MTSEDTATKAAVVVSPKIADVVSAIEKLTVLEASELVKALEERFGVSAAPQAMAMAMPGMMPGGGEAAAAEEQTEFNVVLTAAGDKKIQVIKVVRAITGLGLKEAKDLVDNTPKPVKEGATKEEADDIKAKIEEAGGQVEIK
ncbi:MAG: 50S ribosomal protein L7/L12 [Candidatus Latescibacterota bacterium]|nr:MAG: 50S ribosomal protein L7/L12 [Candidatus Latescibacterota bacterium]